LDNFEVNSSSASLIENELTVSVYPNPAVNILTFNFNEEVQSIKVYSITGNLVAKSTSKEVNVAELAEGTYVYNVLTKSGKVSNGTFVKK
jgi:hypothetical protein